MSFTFGSFSCAVPTGGDTDRWRPASKVAADTTTDTLEINANSKLLSRILINGKQLSEKDYTIDKDKLIIEINNEYLLTLENDENIVEVALTNGQVIKTKLYINEEDNEKPIIDDTDKNEEIKTNKEPFNKNWLYSLLIIPVVYFIIAFVKRKKDN